MTPEEFQKFVSSGKPVKVSAIGKSPEHGIAISFEDGTTIEITPGSQWASGDANIFLEFEQTGRGEFADAFTNE